jgi:hypothetical protein
MGANSPKRINTLIKVNRNATKQGAPSILCLMHRDPESNAHAQQTNNHARNECSLLLRSEVFACVLLLRCRNAILFPGRFSQTRTQAASRARCERPPACTMVARRWSREDCYCGSKPDSNRRQQGRQRRVSSGKKSDSPQQATRRSLRSPCFVDFLARSTTEEPCRDGGRQHELATRAVRNRHKHNERSQCISSMGGWKGEGQDKR